MSYQLQINSRRKRRIRRRRGGGGELSEFEQGP